MSEYKEVYGTQTDRPKEVEVNVDTVYLRKNIERISQTNENGELESLWKYLEKTMTVRAYAEMNAQEGA